MSNGGMSINMADIVEPREEVARPRRHRNDLVELDRTARIYLVEVLRIAMNDPRTLKRIKAELGTFGHAAAERAQQTLENTL
jgi:hypothetical protein